ncbi:uncharacterized protein LOC141588085 [Silene latifolia]|uniref:uncharacterized protein LOC141588085 n=1 Tax=Silene latifolia TaxID=37657 RepID=UPI003D77E48C
MEYLTRILNVVTCKPEFHYHPLCGRLKLSHLCFADDLLVFCRGDSSSLMIFMRALKTFEDPSGLQVNKEKSEIYMNGVTLMDQDKCLRLSGFQLGSFPFRYLGIPISYKRLTVADCNRLTEKMVQNIRAWGARKLSYAGRVVLIKSVLSHIHTYWCRVFIIPSTVMKKIEGICRSFLWSGTEHYKTPLISWDTCCRSQDEGGVRIHSWSTLDAGCRTGGIILLLLGLAGLGGKSAKLRIFSSKAISIIPGMGKLILYKRVRLQRLLTKDRLAKFGVETDATCFLCCTTVETCVHLYYDCVFSAQCLQLVQQWLQINLQGTEIVDWGIHMRCKSLLRKQIIMAGLASMVYHIWMARNKRRLEGAVDHPRIVFQHIKRDVILRVSARLGVIKHKVSYS